MKSLASVSRKSFLSLIAMGTFTYGNSNVEAQEFQPTYAYSGGLESGTWVCDEGNSQRPSSTSAEQIRSQGYWALSTIYNRYFSDGNYCVRMNTHCVNATGATGQNAGLGVCGNIHQQNLSTSNTSLAGMDLRGLRASRSNLSNKNIAQTNFAFANLAGANLQGVTGFAPFFYQVILDKANLRNAQIPQASVYGSAGTYYYPNPTSFYTEARSGLDARSINLSRSMLYLFLADSNFEDANLQELQAYHGSLTAVPFQPPYPGAFASKLSTVKSKFNRANFSNARLSNLETRTYSEFSQSVFAGARLGKVSIISSNFENSNFAGMEVSQFNVGTSRFRNSNFSHAVIANGLSPESNPPSMIRSDISASNLSDSDFKNTSFFCSSLKESNLTRADLRNADFNYADLRNVSGADSALLTGAKFSSCTRLPQGWTTETALGKGMQLTSAPSNCYVSYISGGPYTSRCPGRD